MAGVGPAAHGSIEVVERPPTDGEDAVADNDVESNDGPNDLFHAEEHPLRIVLARLGPPDAADVVDRLERAGIGARVGPPDDAGFVPVIVHDTRLPEAQAVLADLGFAPWAEGEVVDGPDLATHVDPGAEAADAVSQRDEVWADANRRVWGSGRDSNADEPDATREEADGSSMRVDDDGPFIKVASDLPPGAWANARRLASAGVDVRLLVDRYPAAANSVVDVLVPADRLEEARSILHIER
jgi:hypothetical protein